MNRNEIANLALSLLGQTIPVSDFDTDMTVQGRTIKQWFSVTLYQLLRKHPWAFATSYAALPVGTSQPSAGFRFAYQYPANCLIIRRLACDGKFPKVELSEEYARRWLEVNVGTGTEIWTDVPQAHAEFTVRIDVNYDFPDHFALGFAHMLAQNVGPKIISNKWPQMVATFMPEVENQISRAIADDLSMQPNPIEMDSSFIQVRRGW